jgi:hypothetical protein
LFCSGALAARQEWWDALLFGLFGIGCHLSMIHDLRRTASIPTNGRPGE